MKTYGSSLFFLAPVTVEPFMDIELSAIFPGDVFPLYTEMFVIYQKIVRYDVVCEEFGMLQDEHEQKMEKYHGN
jgi:hypothetical protein